MMCPPPGLRLRGGLQHPIRARPADAERLGDGYPDATSLHFAHACCVYYPTNPPQLAAKNGATIRLSPTVVTSSGAVF